MKKQLMLALFCACAVFALSAGGQSESAGTPAEPIRIKMATTTSTDNSGLLGVLVPAFTEKTGIEVDVIAEGEHWKGIHQAIAYGEAGDVDVVFVQARAREDDFVADGYGVNRKDVMYNDFVILGPPSDPAGVKGVETAAEALAAIAAAEADFVSRGDDSGTHIKEKSLWSAAGVTPAGRWYKEAGQGMGTVITMTNDLGGYTLTDRATYLAMKDSLNLGIALEGDKVLFNPYGVIAVNPDKHPHVKFDQAMAFIDYVVSPEGQKVIGDFKVNGEQLFYPDAR